MCTAPRMAPRLGKLLNHLSYIYSSKFAGHLWPAADPPGLPGEVVHLRLRVRPHGVAGGCLLLERQGKKNLDHNDPEINLMLQRTSVTVTSISVPIAHSDFFCSKKGHYYRVAHLMADLGWVDFDLGCSKAGGPLL